MKLHLGCGTKILNGYINIDVRQLEGVHIVSSIDNLSMFTDNSVELIYCCHVLEHLSRHDVLKTLKEWNRVLKPGGVVRISVPNFEAIVEHYNEYKDIGKIRGLLYGGQTYPENYHYNIWDMQSMTKQLEEAGFINVTKYDWRLKDTCNVDDYSQSYLPHMDKDNGRLMSLNVEANKLS